MTEALFSGAFTGLRTALNRALGGSGRADHFLDLMRQVGDREQDLGTTSDTLQRAIT